MADVADEVARVAAGQDDGKGCGETAWNADTATVLYVAGDWQDVGPIEEAFLAVDGVEGFVSEAEALPDGWCDARVVYPDPPPRWVVDACDEALAASAPAAASCMICVKPRPEEAQAVADPDGDPPDTLHVTLAYLGEVEGDLGHLVEALGPVAASHAPLSGTVAGWALFAPALDTGTSPAILLPDVPGLVELRVAVTDALHGAGIDYSRLHGFCAHLTLDYIDGGLDGASPFRPDQAGAPLHFDELLVVRGDVEVIPVPLTGAKPLTAAAEPLVAALPARRPGKVTVSAAHHNAVVQASYRRSDELEPRLVAVLEPILRHAGDKAAHAFERMATNHLTAAGEPPAPGQPPGWSAPAADELLDAAALVAEILARTAPVRRAFLEAAMTPSLRAAGLSFDVTNPLTAQALASSARHIQSIADTTRLNVMRIVRESHDAGLSIPDTASAIRAGMDEASNVRATLIARTELAGISNGGSLAATKIVSQETGDSYAKVWMTAPGAAHPRHEDYDGLDGQTVDLDSSFDVGGSQLNFPGDPDGDPGEVINCRKRCTMSYTDGAGDVTGDTVDSGE